MSQFLQPKMEFRFCVFKLYTRRPDGWGVIFNTDKTNIHFSPVITFPSRYTLLQMSSLKYEQLANFYFILLSFTPSPKCLSYWLISTLCIF